LDKAISGGEVDVITMEEKPLDAGASDGTPPAPLSNQEDGLVTGAEGTGGTDAADDAGAEGPDSYREDNADAANTDEAAAGEDADAGEANADGGAADVNADEADANDDGGETPRMASVQLGAGQVAISAADLEALRADAGKWNEHSAELEQLREWKANSGKPNLVAGAADAADVVGESPKKVSAATQKAIDLKNKMAGN
jgi:hypothetical protein